jgi:pSer/pThr/pTyr-binding forkhead associated (FHA) protein
MEESPTGMARTTRNTGGIFTDSTKIPDELIDNTLIPEGGIAIYAAGTSKPFYLQLKKEIVIGRKLEETPETFLDLSELDGFNMGLSRRHAMIRRAEVGYEIIDLSSTNGSWLNEERLIPEKPYQLKNGAQVRVGRLRLLVIYHSVVEASRKE